MNTVIKRGICFGLALTMLTLAGCGFNKADQPKVTPTAKSTELVVENLEYHVTKKIEQTNVLDVSLIYPQFKNPGQKPGLIAINKVFSDAFAIQKESAVKDQMELATDSYEFSKTSPDIPFLVNSLAVGYELMNKTDGKISVLQSFSSFSGGAHPDSGYSAHTYNIETGKPMTLEEITGKTPEDIKALVTEQVLVAVAKSQSANEGLYNDSYKSDCVQYFDSANFYLKNGKLFVFYQVYDIAPYSSGLPTFEITLK